MATHRLLLESLPVSLSVSRLLAEGKITADMTSVWIDFGAIELKREVRLEHRRFPNGGSWSFFLCPRSDRRVRRLRLNDGRAICSYCCGDFHRISYVSPEPACDSAGTADRKTAQTDRWRPSAPQSPARSRPGPTHVADVCAAAREHCETVGGAARLAHRKVASVMAPTIPLAAIKRTLVDAGESVTGAARTLWIASGTLRGLVRAQPALADVVF